MNKEEKRIERIAELAARKKTWIYAEYDNEKNEIRGHGSAPGLFALACEIVKQMALREDGQITPVEYVDLLALTVKREIEIDNLEGIGEWEPN